MSKPFWKLESEYLNERADLEWECDHAKTLEDAVKCGANMTWFEGRAVGWVNEDGDIQDAVEGLDYGTEVEFYGLDRDDDGYTIAEFKRKEK